MWNLLGQEQSIHCLGQRGDGHDVLLVNSQRCHFWKEHFELNPATVLKRSLALRYILMQFRASAFFRQAPRLHFRANLSGEGNPLATLQLRNPPLQTPPLPLLPVCVCFSYVRLGIWVPFPGMGHWEEVNSSWAWGLGGREPQPSYPSSPKVWPCRVMPGRELASPRRGWLISRAGLIFKDPVVDTAVRKFSALGAPAVRQQLGFERQEAKVTAEPLVLTRSLCPQSPSLGCGFGPKAIRRFRFIVNRQREHFCEVIWSCVQRRLTSETGCRQVGSRERNGEGSSVRVVRP